MTDAQQAALMLRYYDDVISDEECKELHSLVDGKELAKAIAANGVPYNGREAEALAIALGDMDDDHYYEDSDLWRDDILNKYADFVHNYEYTYNDEALKVDPSTDTEQVHIGPMAQDLEKVNPATVQEDHKSGYKTVDTGRLALMNAGAIAELARQVKELKNGV